MSEVDVPSHAPTDFGRAFAIGIGLNVSIVLVEALFGWRAGSLALLAEAGQNPAMHCSLSISQYNSTPMPSQSRAPRERGPPRLRLRGNPTRLCRVPGRSLP